jgi:alkylation response protein AidB-like acyl-CoA dehydrogenase
MDLTFSAEESAFRDELRAWLAANPPGTPPHGDEDAHYGWRRDWQRRLADGGWAAVHWPVEHGGRGATLTQSAIFYGSWQRRARPCPRTCSGCCSPARRS